MNILFLRKPAKKNVRAIIHDEQALRKAAKESIKDQKEVTKKATKLRAQPAR